MLDIASDQFRVRNLFDLVLGWEFPSSEVSSTGHPPQLAGAGCTWHLAKKSWKQPHSYRSLVRVCDYGHNIRKTDWLKLAQRLHTHTMTNLTATHEQIRSPVARCRIRKQKARWARSERRNSLVPKESVLKPCGLFQDHVFGVGSWSQFGAMRRGLVQGSQQNRCSGQNRRNHLEAGSLLSVPGRFCTSREHMSSPNPRNRPVGALQLRVLLLWFSRAPSCGAFLGM